VLDQEGQPEQAAMAAELQYGADSLTEALEGAARFAAGAGRHGADASDD
jgi:enoyl-CoA hydratase